VNPLSGNLPDERALASATTWLQGRGWAVARHQTECSGHAKALAAAAAASGFDVVLVCGGDGTVNEAVNGIAGTDTALAVIPALAAVVGGAYGMVAAAQSLGDRFDVSDIVLGALVLAALTSIPNLIAAVRLARHGRGAACVSEALNSNNANILVGLCVPALILGFGSASGIETFAALWMVGMTVVAVVLGFGGGLTRREGGAIVALYVAFAVVVATVG